MVTTERQTAFADFIVQSFDDKNLRIAAARSGSYELITIQRQSTDLFVRITMTKDGRELSHASGCLADVAAWINILGEKDYEIAYITWERA